MTAPARDRYAVLGNPVAHSQSPFIHAAFAAQTGQALDYERVLCPPAGLQACVQDFAAAGGRGCNITVPFKFDAARLCPLHTPRAALAQAANVLRLDAAGWLADNTDGIGLVRAIEVHARQPLQGLRVLLIGAGGAAAGVLGPLLQARPAAVQVVNRTPANAQALVDRHLVLARACGVDVQAAALAAAGTAHDVVINASASSLQGAAAPVAASAVARDGLAIDLMYGPPAAAFLAWARAAGARAHDGLGMLVEQAAEAFFVWRGVLPETTPVLQALRRRLEAA